MVISHLGLTTNKLPVKLKVLKLLLGKLWVFKKNSLNCLEISYHVPKLKMDFSNMEDPVKGITIHIALAQYYRYHTLLTFITTGLGVNI